MQPYIGDTIMHQNTRSVGMVCTLLVCCLFQFGFFSSSPVDVVKKLPFPQIGVGSIGKTLENYPYLVDGKWDSVETQQGATVVRYFARYDTKSFETLRHDKPWLLEWINDTNSVCELVILFVMKNDKKTIDSMFFNMAIDRQEYGVTQMPDTMVNDITKNIALDSPLIYYTIKYVEAERQGLISKKKTSTASVDTKNPDIGSVDIWHSQTLWVGGGQCTFGFTLDGQGIESPNGLEDFELEFRLTDDKAAILGEPINVTIPGTLADSNSTRYLSFSFGGDCEANKFSIIKATATAGGRKYELLNSGVLNSNKFVPLDILLPKE